MLSFKNSKVEQMQIVSMTCTCTCVQHALIDIFTVDILTGKTNPEPKAPADMSEWKGSPFQLAKEQNFINNMA